MPCLICKYFQAIEPEAHKQLRESGRCESHCGKEWNFWTAVNLVKRHRLPVDGWCLFYPEARLKKSGHVCGQIDVPEHLYTHWGLERRESHHTLMGWSERQYHKLFEKPWEEQRREDLEEQNKELRRQLEASRRVSASRLARLKKQKPEQSTPNKEPAPEEQPLDPLPNNIVRLVAAE